MSTFSNENLVPFKDLSDKQKLEIIKGLENGILEVYNDCKEVWNKKDHKALVLNSIYRVRPEQDTPLDIPWQFIKSCYKWAAMDANNSIWLFPERPTRNNFSWSFGGPPSQTTALNIPTKGIVWDRSLTKRPENI